MPPVHLDRWIFVRIERTLQGHEGKLGLGQVLHPPILQVKAVEHHAIDLASVHPTLVCLLLGLAAWRGGGYEQVETVGGGFIPQARSELGKKRIGKAWLFRQAGCSR